MPDHECHSIIDDNDSELKLKGQVAAPVHSGIIDILASLQWISSCIIAQC